MMHVFKAFKRAKLRHLHASRPADTAEIVAHQIDNHQIFSAILGALSQFLSKFGVARWIRIARPRALDWMRLGNAASTQSQKPLGRSASDREFFSAPHKSRERRRIERAQA